jgi:hypothetical protein
LRLASERILDEWRRLANQWEITCDLWRDVVRHRFDRDFMQAFEPGILSAVDEMDNLAMLIAQARQEVK